jgi:hypothetical protein
MVIQYNAFEESANILSLNRIPRFEAGIDMPWTYYQVDIIEHSDSDLTEEEKLEGKKKFMYTSESTDGESVSEIKRWVKYGTSNIYIEQNIKNPTVEDYQEWGWNLSEDQNGNYILPKFGEFTFKPDAKPDYEENNKIKVEFRIGFGLGDKIYNINNEKAEINIVNLTFDPEIFSSSNKFPVIEYQNENWGTELKKEENDVIECNIEEGPAHENNQGRYAYIFIAVESGEKIVIDFEDHGLNSAKHEIEIFNEEVDATLDENNSRFGILTTPYKSRLNGEETILGGFKKYDFYRIRVNAKSYYNSLKYNFEHLSLRLKISPQSYDDINSNFVKIKTIKLNLEKNKSIPYIREADQSSHGFNTEAPNDFNKQINRNARLIVTAEEAINYGIKNTSGPNFLRNKTPNEAFHEYKQSMLTKTEKHLDEYKLSFKSIEAREKLAYFVTTDLTNTANNNFSNGVNQGDIDKILNNTFVKDAITKFGGASSQELSLTQIKGDPAKLSKFQDVVNLFLVEGNTINLSFLDLKDEESPFKPWTDSNISHQRKFGGINNTTNVGGDNLLDNTTSALVLLYAIHNYYNNSSDELIDEYIDEILEDDSTDTFLKKLEKAMRREYHGVYSTSNSHSLNRPIGFYEELFHYRRTLNPVEGRSAIKYISEIMEIIDETNVDTKYFGTDSIYIENNMTPARITKTEAEDLLYNGDLDKILEAGKILGQDKFPIISLPNISKTIPVFKNLGNDTSKDVMGHFYGSNEYQFSKNTLDTLNFSVDELKGKWVLTKTGNMDFPYNDEEWYKENEDLSGIIRLPKSDEGCYFDFYVNGIEVHETMVDIETGNSDRYSQNFDPVNTYEHYSTSDQLSNYYLSQDIKSSRKTIIEDETIKFQLVNVGIFQFLRVGEVVHFFANNNDYDAEDDSLLNFPSFEIIEREDNIGECKLLINNALVPLRDVHSELTITINPERGSPTEYQLGDSYNKDEDGIFVSRWTNVTLPIDIKGGLEKGEKFQISITNDSWVGDSEEVSSTQKYDLTNSVQEIPSGFEAEKMYIEYKNREYRDSEWKSAEGVTFEYERHNKLAGDPDIGDGFNSYGGDNNEYSKSSNIKGLPEFRVVLPAQFKLLDYYNNQNNTTSFVNAFGVLGRQATIELKYTKSAKINDVDGNNVSDEIRFLVDSDKYDPKICVSEITYDNNNNQNIESEFRVRSIGHNSNYTGYVEDLRKIVGFNTTEHTNGHEIPDMTTLKAYEFKKSYLEHLDGDKRRLFEFIDLEFKENNMGSNYGSDRPIARINISNFLRDGNYGVNATISPIFKYELDEIMFEETGQYNFSADNNVVNDNKDGNANMPRLIPANSNYSVYFTNNNNQLWLYRNKNINYEKWVGGSGGIYTYNNFYDKESGPYREVVNVKISYSNPQTGAHENDAPRKTSILFFVEPKDVKEIHYANNFHFTVNEGDESIDISPILSATIEGKTDGNIEYFIRGIIDESGVSHFFNDTKDDAVDELTSKLYSSQFAFATDDIESGLTFNSNKNLTYSHEHGIGGQNMKHKNLVEEMVDGKLILYHENYGVEPLPNLNNKFDVYYQKFYNFYVEAKYNVQDQSEVENALALVTIEVENEGSNFYVNNDNRYHNVIETMGTVSEGKGQFGNNPEIPLSTFLDNLRHEDLGDVKLYNQENITFEIHEIDPALEVIKYSIQPDFSDQVIRLKDIDSNKTTETDTETSSKLAPFAHYNYERQKEYGITLKVCLTNNYEINVEKLPSDHIFTSNDNKYKTATYVIKPENNSMFSTSDPADHQHNGKLYYFKDSETGLYHGPLSVIPQNIEDLHNTVRINNIDVYHAYARFEKEENCYTALYKANGFRNNFNKPPKPIDICLQPFSIKVIDSFDKQKVSPQPYKLKENTKYGYRKADPHSQENLDVHNIEAFECRNHVAYVFSDHDDLDPHQGKDVGEDFKIPTWHPNYKNPTDSDYTEGDNKTEQFDREIHENALMCHINAGYNNGLYNGSFDKNVQGSWEFGKFTEEGINDAVILDFFVEYHDRINPSGTNSIFTGKTPFGTEIDYSGTLIYKDGIDGPVIDSDKRMFRLSNINRSKKHTHDLAVDSHYATGELEMNSEAKEGEVYSFTVVAVTNILATSNDLNYNKNMVDWNENFYPKININGIGYPQPFQKYAYDASANKIVTHSYAKSLNILDELNHNNIDEADKGTLLCCRTHFTVKVKSESDIVETSTTENNVISNVVSNVVTGNGNLQVDSVIKGMTDNDDNILPLESIPTPKEDDLRLFNIGNSKIIMAMFKDGKWVSLD